jgi:hypothetical protein
MTESKLASRESFSFSFPPLLRFIGVTPHIGVSEQRQMGTEELQNMMRKGGKKCEKSQPPGGAKNLKEALHNGGYDGREGTRRQCKEVRGED